MSGRGPLLTRTRCPECGTVFRVTSEQLRLKAGKVRCGHCHGIFNAFDQLLPIDPPPEAIELRDGNDTAPVVDNPPATEAETFAAPPQEEPAPPPVTALPADEQETSANAAMPTLEEDPDWAEAAAEVGEEALDQPPETPEQTTHAARQAGLVAVRELAESQAYDRWSAGPLADGGLSGFAEESRPPAWPYLLVGLLLLLVLTWQAAYHFRADLVLRLPVAGQAFAALDIPVPLPRDDRLVSIETSDLQSDPVRGLFILNATLKNRATYAQAWPDLELTLTDAADQVVARRVIVARDYLSAGVPRDAFPANGETAVRLWIETSGIAAAGYRLYIFYP